MNDEQHLRKSTRVLKPTRKLLEQLETEEWIKSQETQRYVLDDGESVISQIKSVSMNSDGSEHSVKSKCSKTSYNAKVGLSNVHTNQFRMYKMLREPQLDIEHRSEYSIDSNAQGLVFTVSFFGIQKWTTIFDCC